MIIYITRFLRLLEHLMVIAIIIFCFVRCNEKKSDKVLIGKSTGTINSVTIVMDDMLWNREVGDSLRKKLAAPVDGLPQEEPLFTIIQYPLKALDGDKINHRNVIIVKKDIKNSYEFTKNQFAKPQNVVYIKGRSTDEILEHIQLNTDDIIKNFKASEIIAKQIAIKKNLDEDFSMLKKFNLSLSIPKGYQTTLVKSNFVWIKKEMVSGNNSILAYTVPFKVLLKDNNIINNIVAMRDSIEGKYIKSKAPNSRMVTEKAYAPYFQNIILDNKRAFEMKGTWELKGDFMSGSFINYAIIDKKRRRFVIVEGFCYAPSTQKRDLMFELEAIIKTIEISK